MRNIFIFIIIAIFAVNAKSQQIRSDLGVFIGGSYYLGDINTSTQFYNTRLSGGALYRHNFKNARFSVRGSLLLGTLSADDMDFPFEYQIIRNRSFTTSFYDLTGQFEFNFFPYKPGDDKNNNTPYVAAGISFFYGTDIPFPFQLAIPFGVGYKFNVSERVSAGFEWTFRKTFTDLIDNVTGFDDIPVSPVKQVGFINNNDWFSIAGLFITFKIPSGDHICPAYDAYN